MTFILVANKTDLEEYREVFIIDRRFQQRKVNNLHKKIQCYF